MINPSKQDDMAYFWGNLANYALDISNEGKRVDQGSIRYSNFKESITSLQEAVEEVKETQKCCKSKSDNKIYHLAV